MTKTLYLLLFSVIGLIVTGCQQKTSVEGFSETDTPVWTLSSDEVELGTTDFETFDIAADYTPLKESISIDTTRCEYVENTTFDRTIKITFAKEKAIVTGGSTDLHVQTDGAHVSISAPVQIKVELTGTTANGSVKVMSDKKVCLVLHGLQLTNPQGAAISCLSKKECYLVTDSISALSDDSLQHKSKEESQKGCLFAEGKLFISGTAPLKITSYSSDAIHSDKSIFVRRSSQLDIYAFGGDALQAKRNIRIEGGMLNILSTARGCSGITARKVVEIAGGRTTIISKTPGGKGNKNSRGIRCDSLISIKGGIVRIKEESRGGKGIRSGHDVNIAHAIVDILTSGEDDKCTGSKNKGIKAANTINIDSARVRVRCQHGRNEALEGSRRITITGSLVELRAADDAISVSRDDGKVIINSGYIYAHAGNDAIDSNGTIHVLGGLVYAFTNGAGGRGFDCDKNDFQIAPEAFVISVGNMISPPTSRFLKHPIAFVAVPNATKKFVVTASDSDTCIFGIERPSFSYRDLDWSVLFSVPEMAKCSSLDICQAGKISPPTHTFHGLHIGGETSEKEIKHQLTLDKPFVKIYGKHPYSPKAHNKHSSAQKDSDHEKKKEKGKKKDRKDRDNPKGKKAKSKEQKDKKHEDTSISPLPAVPSSPSISPSSNTQPEILN